MSNKLDTHANYYFDIQLDFDRKLIEYRYNTIKNYFRGNIALEMGSADGVMTKWLKDDFSELDILEGSQKLLDNVPDYPNATKYCSWFEEFVPKRKYDTIIMEHILEHIENPVFVLSKVKNWLADDGVLIIGVPNAKSFHRLAAVKMGLLPTEYTLNDRDRIVGHYRVYDKESLAADAIKAGFKIIDSGGVFFKPVSNKQIDTTWTEEMIEGFYQLGKDFPDHAAEIFVIVA